MTTNKVLGLVLLIVLFVVGLALGESDGRGVWEYREAYTVEQVTKTMNHLTPSQQQDARIMATYGCSFMGITEAPYYIWYRR